MHVQLRSALTVTLLFGFASALCAGTVDISGGGQLTGDVKKVDSAKDSYVIVRVDDQLSIAVAGVQVRQTVESERLAEYRQRVVDAGQDAEAHYELARWCKQENLLHQSRYHYTRVIDLDPDHSRARAALGFVEDRGEWVSFEKLKRGQGLINDRGRWTLPEVVAEREAESDWDTRSKAWIKKLARLRSKAVRGDAEAVNEIIAIDDPTATRAVARELLSRGAGTSGQDRPLRMVWVRLLAKLKASPAIATLTEVGLTDADDVVREEALRQLTTLDPGSAVASYVPWLRSSDPQKVKLAARALAFFPDPELAFQYTNSLVTTQVVRTQVGSGGTDAAFDNTGGGGMAMGSKTIETPIQTRHPEVLNLLRLVAPDANFGYDENAWRSYFAGLRNPPRSDLRRDP